MRTTPKTTAAALAAALLLLGFAGEGTTVTVSGDTAAGENDPHGWMFNRDASTATPFDFTTAAATLGTGSLEVFPIGTNPADKMIAEYFVLGDAADVTSFSYDFQRVNRGTSQVYLNVYTNLAASPVNGFYDCRFDFVAPASAVGAWATEVYTPARVADNVQSRNSATCPTTVGGLPIGSTIRAFSLNLGDTGAGDAGDAAHFDRVVYTTSSSTTTYDFEPAPNTPTSKDDCKKGGFAAFETADREPFRNQGQCVAYVNANA